MQPDEDSTPVAAKPLPRRSLLWGCFLLLVAMFAGFKLWQNARYDAALDAWEKAEPTRLAKRDAIAEDLRSHTDATPEEIQAIYHLKTPLQFEPLAGRSAGPDGPRIGVRVGWWQDPALDARFCLVFFDGKLDHVSAIMVSHDARKHVPSTLWDLSNAIRDALVFWTPLGWLPLIVPLCLTKRGRGAIAEVALALVFVRVAAGLLPTRGWITGRTIFEGPEWIYDSLMLGASAAALVVAYWPKRAVVTDPLCRKCGYNLTGNISGVCPECGTPLPAWLIRKLTSPVVEEPARPEELLEHVSDEQDEEGVAQESNDETVEAQVPFEANEGDDSRTEGGDTAL